MGDRRWNSNEGRKDIHARRRTQGGDNLITPRHSSRRAWREVEDDRIDHQELLVARSNERDRKICGWM